MKMPVLKKYRNGEFIEYLRNTVEITQSHISTDFPIEPHVTALASIVDTIDDAFIHEQGSILTQELEQLDLLRDQAIIGIRGYLAAMENHYDSVKAAAATQLLVKMDSYGSQLSKMNYQVESTVLLNLVDDYQKDEAYTEALTLLELNEWVAHLKTSNEAFRVKYKERIGEKSTAQTESVSSMRPEATQAYSNLVSVIEAYHTLTPTAQNTQCINQLDVLTEEYNMLVLNRTSRTKSKDDDLNLIV